jgi:hypothetical protein
MMIFKSFLHSNPFTTAFVVIYTSIIGLSPTLIGQNCAKSQHFLEESDHLCNDEKARVKTSSHQAKV